MASRAAPVGSIPIVEAPSLEHAQQAAVVATDVEHLQAAERTEFLLHAAASCSMPRRTSAVKRER